MIRSRSALGGADQTEFQALATSIVEAALDASQVARRLIDWTTKVDGDRNPAARRRRLLGSTSIESSGRSSNLQQASNPSQSANGCSIYGRFLRLSAIVASFIAMFDHLIRNACEALAGGSGHISFTTLVDRRNWLVIEVGDSGCGMSPETLKRATEPFFSTKSGHDGVGLTIAQAIWRRHRGAVSIESTPRQGYDHPAGRRAAS